MLKVGLKRMGALSLLAIAALASSPTSALAGQQRNGQQSTANAIAQGDHARAVNNVHQSIYQIYLGSPAYQGNDGYSNGYDNGYNNGYWVDPQSQSSDQQATANAAAVGDNSTAVSNVNQSNYQDQLNYQNGLDNPVYGNNGYGNDGYGYWVDPQSQSSDQQATANAAAVGDNSTAVSNMNQSNYQDQLNYQNGSGNPVYWNGGYGW